MDWSVTEAPQLKRETDPCGGRRAAVAQRQSLRQEERMYTVLDVGGIPGLDPGISQRLEAMSVQTRVSLASQNHALAAAPPG